MCNFDGLWLSADTMLSKRDDVCDLRCSQNPPQESPETRGFFEAVKFPLPHHAWPRSSYKVGVANRSRSVRPDRWFGVVRMRPRDRGSRADGGPQVLPPARATVPPWLPA